MLGTDFISDVLLVRLRVDKPITLRPELLSSQVALRTIAEALTIAATGELDIDASELQAEYRPALTPAGNEGLEAEIYLYDTLAGGAGLAIGAVEVRGGDGVRAQERVGCDLALQPRTDRESIFRERDGGLEQCGPRQLPMLAMREFQHAYRAGHADRAPAHDRGRERHGLAVASHEEVARRPGGGRFAAVVRFDLAAVVMQQQGTPADAARVKAALKAATGTAAVGAAASKLTLVKGLAVVAIAGLVTAVAAGYPVLVRPRVPVLVRVDVRNVRQPSAAGDHLVDPSGRQRAASSRLDAAGLGTREVEQANGERRTDWRGKESP